MPVVVLTGEKSIFVLGQTNSVIVIVQIGNGFLMILLYVINICPLVYFIYFFTNSYILISSSMYHTTTRICAMILFTVILTSCGTKPDPKTQVSPEKNTQLWSPAMTGSISAPKSGEFIERSMSGESATVPVFAHPEKPQKTTPTMGTW